MDENEPNPFPDSRKEHFAKNEDPSRSIAGETGDRVFGLDLAFDKAKGASVLDIGCHDGRIAERFAMAGAAHIDGLDISATFIEMAAERFLGLPTRSRFRVADLSKGAAVLEGLELLNGYDLVCYLGVHHHLKKQMPGERLSELVQVICAMASDHLVIRTPQVHFDPLLPEILATGFEPVSPFFKGKIAPVRHFQRLS